MMSILFSPLKINSLEFRNRIAVSPMCTYSSTNGFASDWHLVHLGSRAMGGARLVMTEATAISPEGRISATDWVDEGWDLSQSARLSALLKDKGVDLMDVSSGGSVADVKIQVGYENHALPNDTTHYSSPSDKE